MQDTKVDVRCSLHYLLYYTAEVFCYLFQKRYNALVAISVLAVVVHRSICLYNFYQTVKILMQFLNIGFCLSLMKTTVCI